MKTFAAFALFAASLATAQTATAGGQVTYNSTTGVFTCPADNPNGAFCVDASLQSNIIIRCTNGIGQPGNCNDNLSGEPPTGLSYAPCWETNSTSGDAACSKNCVVYGSSGNYNGTFTLPDCTPISSSSSASPTSTSSTASSTSQSATTTPSSSTASASSTLSSSSTTATVTTISTFGSTTETLTYTTTYCPSISTPSTIILSTGTGSGSTATGSSNGTLSTGGAGGATSTGSPTATPVGPTTTASGTFTGGATTASAGSLLAAVGLAIAYIL